EHSPRLWTRGGRQVARGSAAVVDVYSRAAAGSKDARIEKSPTTPGPSSGLMPIPFTTTKYSPGDKGTVSGDGPGKYAQSTRSESTGDSSEARGESGGSPRSAQPDPSRVARRTRTVSARGVMVPGSSGAGESGQDTPPPIPQFPRRRSAGYHPESRLPCT